MKTTDKRTSFPVKKEAVREYLKENITSLRIITEKQVGSTNDEVKKLVDTEKKEPVLFVAESQTKGRGRLGRSFYSPESSGIYMSLLFYPEIKAEECPLLTGVAAVAVAEAIEAVTGIKTQIKWVNDVYVGGKKVAGILTEGAFAAGELSYAVVGIGINLTAPPEGFPKEIESIAAGVTDSENENTKSALVAEIINRFMHYYENLRDKTFLDGYRKRLFFLGEKVTVISPGGSYEAVAEDIDDMCRLIVKLSDSSKKILSGGEISIRPKK